MILDFDRANHNTGGVFYTMAKSDYNVADRQVQEADGTWVDVTGNNAEITAGAVVNRDPVITPDADAKTFADSAGVSQAAYANYSEALGALEARADIESLADRRRRTYGDAFTDADFMRQQAYNADGSAQAAPRPGTVHGDADDSASGATVDDTP